MAELYERLLGVHPTKDKVSTDGLQACMRLFRGGQMNEAQINALFEAHYGGAFGTAQTGDEAGRREVQDLLATIPTGATTTNRLDRIERSSLIEAVLIVADLKQAPFDTPAGLRTAFGVPDRSV
jgi:hypothetical protein